MLGPLDIGPGQGPDVDLKFQLGEELLESGLRAHRVPVPLLFVEPRPQRVLGRRRGRHERPQPAQEFPSSSDGGQVTDSTSGSADRTPAISTGLSSRNRKLSGPRPSVRAASASRADFGPQVAESTLKCWALSRLSGRSRTARTVASSLLLTSANSAPAARH